MMIFRLKHLKENEGNTKNRMMPPTYLIFLLLASIVLNSVFPIKKVMIPPYSYLGSILIIFGIVLNIWCDSLFKKRKTTIKPHEIPTSFEISGPYKMSRNPIYLGMASILTGTALLLGSIITFLTPVVFLIIMDKLFIPMEEKNLENKFGREYVNYKKRVRRWI